MGRTGPLCVGSCSSYHPPGQDVVIHQGHGEQPGLVQPRQIDLIPENEDFLGDTLLKEKEGALGAQWEVGTGDVEDGDEGRLGVRRGLWGPQNDRGNPCPASRASNKDEAPKPDIPGS